MENSTAMKSETTVLPSQTSRLELTAKAKCQAILAIWTEKATISAVCRELSLQRAQVERLEALALEGMLQALQPRPRGRRASAATPESLPNRLTKLLERKFNPPAKAQAKPASTLVGKLDQAEKKVRKERAPKTSISGE